jgi:exosortase A
MLWFGVYITPLQNMVSVWLGSETYTYCFFIVPIVLYLIHEKRHELANIPIQITWWPLIPLALIQSVYLLADLSGIAVITHLSAYSSLIAIIAICYGMRLLQALLFPLAYLVLAVPMGEEFIPILQNITADISVYLVQLVGIPVYREGLFIYIPNGTFQVAEACSGIRFLIAMIAIGLLYAHLFYRSIYRRIIFVAISIVLPIIANGIRAFGIIYIGYKSDMEYATGADHLIYGWVFFSMVLILLMTIGKLWREDELEEQTLTTQAKVTATVQQPLPLKSTILVSVVVALVLVVKPLYYHQITAVQQASVQQLNANKNSSTASASVLEAFWHPSFEQADQEQVWQYHIDLNSQTLVVTVYQADYWIDNHQKELVNSGNRLFDVEQFSIKQQQPLTLTLDDQTTVSATKLTIVNAHEQRFDLIYWYQVASLQTSDLFAIKKAQLIDKLTGGTGGGSVRIIAYPSVPLSNQEIQQIVVQIREGAR